ncbi:MAG: hypothetical protein R6V05_12400 [Candidatus Brocadiia bacterium]
MKHALLLAGLFALVVVLGCYPEEWADVAPGGEHLAVARLKEGLFYVSTDGEEARRLAPNGWNPRISPDGRYCAFTSFAPDTEEPRHARFTLYDLETDSAFHLASVTLADEDKAAFFWPDWHPDTTKLAYVRWTFREEALLTELRLRDLEERTDDVLAENVGFHAAWSPDGSRLAFLQSDEPLRDGDEFALGTLVVTEGLDVQKPRGRVVYDYTGHVAWLSDDRLVLGARSLGLPTAGVEMGELPQAAYVVDLAEDTVEPIEATRGMDWHQWGSPLRVSPGGERLLFGRKDTETDQIGVWCYDFASEQATQIIESSADGYPFWVSEDEVGCFIEEDAIVILTLDEEDQVVGRRMLSLEDML